MSHSSRCQGSRVHQSPEVRQGPARSSTLPRTPSAMTKLGWPDARATRAARRLRALGPFDEEKSFLDLSAGAADAAEGIYDDVLARDNRGFEEWHERQENARRVAADR